MLCSVGVRVRVGFKVGLRVKVGVRFGVRVGVRGLGFIFGVWGLKF